MAARCAVALLGVLLTVLCTPCAADAITDTLAFLRDLQDTFPTSLASWSANDSFCTWEGVSCGGIDLVSVTLSNLVAADGATLPEVTSDDLMIYTLTLQVDPTTPVTLPASWSKMTKLWWVRLEDGFTGELPISWNGLPSFTMFYANRTDFNGTLPSAWSNMSSLTLMVLSGNANLGGTLPESWSNWSIALGIGIIGANVTGTLPASWSKLPRLIVLEISDSNVYGTLPEEWGSFSSMSALAISNNSITGTLPNWASSTLQEVDLSNNDLNGTLPASWSAMNLTSLTIAGNDFCGCEPDSWKNVSALHAAAAETATSWINCSLVNSCTKYPAIVLNANDAVSAPLSALFALSALAAFFVCCLIA